ncbi:MAG: hypothetical protein NC293_13635, partial [Roseburia sp.]|nr:hypothetical protein [Roseburia sp.]
GKSAKIKLKVTPFVSDKTPAPTATPDPRKSTVVEDFESYDVGTVWTKYTSRGKNSGTMTVVQDPENAENKCLKVVLNGPDAAFDFAPVFNVDLTKPDLKDSDGNPVAGKTLGSYSTIRADWRVIGNDSDVQNKRLWCYFDQPDAIKTTDAFATNDNTGATAHVTDKSLRFGVNISMAEGVDKESGITLSNGNSSKENSKWLPGYYSGWKPEDASTHYGTDSCTTGFKWAEADAYTAGFATKYLVFDTGRIKEADATLLDQSKFDVVIGTQYKGDSQLSGNHIFYYVDNVALVEEDIPITGFELSLSEGGDKVYPGGDTTVNVTYTPQETTQKELTWTSNNPQVAVNSEGKVTVPEDFDFGGQSEVKVVITATSKSNPALTKSVDITVCQLVLPTEPYVLDLDKMVTEFFDAELSDEGVTVEKTTDADGEACMKINFTAKNQRAFFKLPAGVMLSAYQKYELTGFVPQQMTLDFFGEKLPTDKATADKWWNLAAAKTVPFYHGSMSNRAAHQADQAGNPAINAKEMVSGLLSGIKNSEAGAHNFNDVHYVALGNACNDDDGYVPDGTYYIYDLRLTPRPQGNLSTYTFATVPMQESFENAASALLEVDNSKIVEGTAESPAQEGTHYMEVASGDTPAILIDNRGNAEDAKYTIKAYVKAKDPSESATIQFLATSIFAGEKYAAYEGYEDVLGLNCIANKQDLSSAEGWVQIRANLTVSAGKISEVSIGNETGISFGYLLDSVSLETRQ